MTRDSEKPDADMEGEAAATGHHPLGTVVDEPRSHTEVDSVPHNEQTFPASSAAVADPERIGRFVVLERLGVGGMGVVVAALDPTLNRKVAIKVLHGAQWRAAVTLGRSKLVAEAQAMAKLSHPNVVTLHEIGFDDDGTFLVMDYVAGTTLRGWLEDSPRSWREIVAMFIAAGEGLAAAHQQGIVHRDFKPDNVLVGRDGRGRVTDFGIAALTKDAQAASPAGTPSYMAPEQLRGEPCDHRADQFAFCVALWEALYGTRPFVATAPEERLTEIHAGRLTRSARSVPRWLSATLRRGLATDAEERWPSTHVLLKELGRAQRRRRVSLACALSGCVMTALLALWPRAAREGTCSGAVRQLVGVWDLPRKTAVLSAFAATSVPYLDTMWRSVQRRLDQYTSDWTDLSNATCRATRVEHLQSDAEMDLRMDCLEQRRRQLQSLTVAWSRGVDREGVARALEAVSSVPPVSDCSDLRALAVRVPVPRAAIAQSQIEIARQYLDRLREAMSTYRLADARRLAEAARTASDLAGWVPLRAEAALAVGELLRTLSERDAEARLREAGALADAARDDRLRLRALIQLIYELAEHQQNALGALQVADLAAGVAARAGTDELMQTRLARARGKALFVAAKYDAARAIFTDVHSKLSRRLGRNDEETINAGADLAQTISTQGDFAAAHRLYNELIAAATKFLGPNHPQTIYLINDQANALYRSGDVKGAKASYERALVLAERVFGPNGLYTALTLQNAARIPAFYLDLPTSAAMYKRALAIRESKLGPDHPYIAVTLANLGSVLHQQKRSSEALAMMRRALAIKLKAYGEDHPSTADTYDQIGTALRDQEDYAAAIDAFRHVLDIRRRVFGSQHHLTQVAAGNIASIYMRQHRCGDALPLLEPALRVLEPLNSDIPSTIDMLLQTSQCLLNADPHAAVMDRLVKARALIKTITDEPAVMGSVDYLAARVQWAAGQYAEARRLVHRALKEMIANEESEDALAEVRSWTRTHVR